MWNKNIIRDENEQGIDYEYICNCGFLQDEENYNGDTGHYECPQCGSESPDLDMIMIVDEG